MLRRWTASAAVIACLAQLPVAACAASRAAFALVRDGRPAATIVLAKRPSHAAAFAAAELQDHVQRITGAALPIVTEGAPVSGDRILVGESTGTRRLGLRSSGFAAQEYLIRIRTRTLVLMGRDGDSAEHVSKRDGTLPPGRAPGRFGLAGSFDGAHTFASLAVPKFSDEQGTLEAWVRLPLASSPGEGTILRLDGDGPWTYHIVQRTPNARRIIYQTYDGTTVRAVTSGELDGRWHHVVATHSVAANRIELFIDGASQGTAEYRKTTCAGAVMGIGGMPPTGGRSTPGNTFRGEIDEVRVSRVVRRPDAAGPFQADRDTVALLHFDERSGAPADVVGTRAPQKLPDFFAGNGTLYAVYDFLERDCGVRWYMPGDVGLVCPHAKSLIVRGGDVRRAPAMAYRWITPTALYVPTPKDRVPAREVDLWKLRIRQGGQQYAASHSFYGYYDRFLKTHPEWFAKGYSGQPPQMCYTNPGFIAQVVKDARDYFDGKGAQPGAMAMGDFFALVPMDNCSWCKCPACQAELNRAEEHNRQFTNGKASDYIFGFVNKVAREVRKSHPHKWIATLAYSDYGYYPSKVALEPNVAVQLCLHVRNWWCPSMERNDSKVLAQFTRDRRRPVYLWLYYCFPALNGEYEHYNLFPGFFAHSVIRQARMFHRDGIRGIFMEHSSEFAQSFLGDVPDMYLTWKLADDPTLNGQAVLDEFFQRFYGAASAPMQRVYTAIERTFCDPRSYPLEIQREDMHRHQNEQLAWGSLGTPERMAAFARLMAEAKAAARTDMERLRVAQFEQGVWLPMVAGAEQHAKRATVH